MQTRSFDEAEKMIEDELDEDFQSSSPVVERDVTVSCFFFSLKRKARYTNGEQRLQDDFKQFLNLSVHFKDDFDVSINSNTPSQWRLLTLRSVSRAMPSSKATA
jgi:hypothetical protein